MDFDKLKTEGNRQAAMHEKNVIKREVAILNAVERRLNIDPHDPVVKAVEQLLGIIAGGQTAALETLGITAGTENNEGPAALPAPKQRRSDWAPVYQSDGENIAIEIEKIRFDDTEGQRSHGLVPMEDNDGNVVAYRKRPTPIPATTVSPVTPADNTVQVVDKNGAPVRKISLASLASTPAKYVVVHSDADGNADTVIEKPARHLRKF